jgi:hypothetical protein
MKLRGPLNQPGLAEILRHIPLIDKGTLVLAAHWRYNRFGNLKLFGEMAAECMAGRLSEVLRLMNDTADMERLLDRGERPPESIRELRRLHDRYVRLMNEAQELNRLYDIFVTHIDGVQDDLDFNFPPPPIPGNDMIVPIDTPAMLFEEGRQQHHCAAIKVRAVQAGNTYLYRILQPERATLSIDRVARGWVLGELLAAYNTEVRIETLQVVRAWLKQRQPSRDRKTGTKKS